MGLWISQREVAWIKGGLIEYAQALWGAQLSRSWLRPVGEIGASPTGQGAMKGGIMGEEKSDLAWVGDVVEALDRMTEQNRELWGAVSLLSDNQHQVNKDVRTITRKLQLRGVYGGCPKCQARKHKGDEL